MPDGRFSPLQQAGASPVSGLDFDGAFASGAVAHLVPDTEGKRHPYLPAVVERPPDRLASGDGKHQLEGQLAPAGHEPVLHLEPVRLGSAADREPARGRNPQVFAGRRDGELDRPAEPQPLLFAAREANGGVTSAAAEGVAAPGGPAGPAAPEAPGGPAGPAGPGGPSGPGRPVGGEPGTQITLMHCAGLPLPLGVVPRPT